MNQANKENLPKGGDGAAEAVQPVGSSEKDHEIEQIQRQN